MTGSKVDSVRLKAAIEILALAGISKETRISVKTDTTGLSETEVDKRLAALLGRAEATVIEGTFTDISEESEDSDSEEGTEEEENKDGECLPED